MCRSFTLCPDDPQHLPSASQEPSETYLIVVIILCSLLIPHNLKYTISIGSNMTLYKTQSLVVFQILHGFAFCMYQFNFASLLELFGGICKMKSLAALVNECFCLGCCSVLLRFSWRGTHFCIFTIKHYVLDTIVTGQEEQLLDHESSHLKC